MRIAILGAGAMGMLFSGYLSQKNEVWVIDVDKSRVDKINRDGVLIRESDGSDRCFHVKAVADSSGLNENSLNFFFPHYPLENRSAIVQKIRNIFSFLR